MIWEGLAQFYFKKGLQHIRENKITPAVATFEKAVALNGGNWKIANVLGLCYYRLGDFSGAKRSWKRSQAQYTENNPATSYLEDLHGIDFSNCWQGYNKALKLAGDGKYRQAERILLLRETACFSFVSFTNLLGLCQYGRGKKKKALYTWLQALSLDREHPLTLKYLQQGFAGTKNQGILNKVHFFFW